MIKLFFPRLPSYKGGCLRIFSGTCFRRSFCSPPTEPSPEHALVPCSSSTHCCVYAAPRLDSRLLPACTVVGAAFGPVPALPHGRRVATGKPMRQPSSARARFTFRLSGSDITCLPGSASQVSSVRLHNSCVILFHTHMTSNTRQHFSCSHAAVCDWHLRAPQPYVITNPSPDLLLNAQVCARFVDSALRRPCYPATCPRTTIGGPPSAMRAPAPSHRLS
jgi:hypothetical protein